MKLFKPVSLFFRREPLLTRFPKFHPLPDEAQEIIPLDHRSEYSSFEADFVTLETYLMQSFRELDNKALEYQNTYRWMYIILIAGSTIATMLSIIQIASPDTDWFGIAGAGVAAILGIVTSLLQRFNYQTHYMDTRLRTERLRSEYFMFLGHFDVYADKEPDAQNPDAQKRNDHHRVRQLQKRIFSITREEGTGESAQ